MRTGLLIIFFAVCQMNVAAQKKASLPPTTQTIPDKDLVVSIDNIEAGKSKRYHWHSENALLTINTALKKGSSVDICLNGRYVVRHYGAVNSTQKTRKLKLKDGINTIIIKPHKSAKTDSFILNFFLDEAAMEYNVTAQLKKGTSDTLFIIKH